MTTILIGFLILTVGVIQAERAMHRFMYRYIYRKKRG